jgi:hypothetical protein
MKWCENECVLLLLVHTSTNLIDAFIAAARRGIEEIDDKPFLKAGYLVVLACFFMSAPNG